MFKGEKTYVFWIGLIILGLAAVVLFSIIWFNVLGAINRYGSYMFFGFPIEFQVPFIVASIVFVLIGLYMMKSGIKK